MRRSRRSFVWMATLGSLTSLVITVVPVSPVAQAAPGESQVPIANPDLDRACGLNVMVILDESGSIAQSGATEDVRNAYRAFISSLNNTGSSVATVEFSSQARLPVIGGSPQGAYITIDNSTVPAFNAYISNGFNPSGYTNWEDAMRVGRFFAPRPDPEIPHLVVFITDGDPTAYVNLANVTNDEYRTKVPLADNEVRTNQSTTASLGPAIPNANALKAGGSHILAIGVGEALQNQSSVNRLIAMSDDDVFDGTGTFDISTDDVYLEPNFENLEDALREAAFQLCAPSVSIRKVVDFTPDPDSADDAVPGSGFGVEGTVTNIPAAQFDWVLPHGADEDSASANALTDGSGFATFQWTPANPSASSDFQALETTDHPLLNPVAGDCTFRTPDTPDEDFPYEPIEDADGNPIGFFLEDIPSESIVTCLFINIVEPDPSIDIEKYTNGVDADEPTGPFIPVGADVEWSYVVTNTGNLTLSDIEVTDDPIGTIDCPSDTLAQGEDMICTATDVALAGQYANEATVTAVDSYGNTSADDPGLTDSDPSHYFGDLADIEIEKFTVVNSPPFDLRADADTYIDADGNVIAPLIPVGTDVTWEYEVSNPGTVAVEQIEVIDSEAGITVTCPADTLAAGATMICQADQTVPAVAGAYENIGTVTAVDPNFPDDELTDADPSHYLGYELSVDIVKYTNGQDANAADGSDAPLIRAGSTVHWTYEVINTGNVPLTDLELTDDQGVAVSCPDTPDPLLAGATIICEATGTALDTGLTTPYANLGTVVASPSIPPEVTLPPGHPLLTDTATASDPSHYLGVLPSITIEKATNGEDADDPTGPFVPLGDPVTWSFVVTNNGSAPLTDIVAVDYRAAGGFTLITCPDDSLDPGESMNCTNLLGISEEGQFVNGSSVVGVDPFGETVGDLDPSHYFGAESAIDLEKNTNGLDADEPPGAFIQIGQPVEWTYVVTNIGNTAIDEIVVTDVPAQTITCPADTLAPAASMTCTATGVAVAGQYENTATVVGVDAAEEELTDTDPSHYFGFLVAVDIEKATNGEDADDPTGPVVEVGSTVTWTYVVTNPGDVPLREVVVTDDQGVMPVFQGGDSNGDMVLDLDETWTYQATGIAVLGQYANVGTVDAVASFEAEGIPVTDFDPSHYLAVDPAIQIVKTPDTAEVPRGVGHTFTIEVTNTGTEDLTGVVVTDPVTPSCEQTIGDLAVGEVVTYDCDVDAVYEVINNVAFVEGTDQYGTVVTDDDPAQVIPVEVGGTALIGDTVWRDDNANGVQDPGEQGIAGARVRIRTISNTPFNLTSLTPVATPFAIDVTLVTDADGHYLEPGLVAGTYEVSLDLTSVTGTPTTPVVDVVPLFAGDAFLDADFGVVTDDLPFTGSSNWTIQLLKIAAILVCAGAGIVLIARSGPRVWRRLTA